MYKVYNEGKGRSYEPITWEGIKDQVETFRSEQIYTHIAAIEKETKVYAPQSVVEPWLRVLTAVVCGARTVSPSGRPSRVST